MIEDVKDFNKSPNRASSSFPILATIGAFIFVGLLLLMLVSFMPRELASGLAMVLSVGGQTQ